MTLVERMARAICAETAHEMPDPNYFADRNQHHWTPEALAALKAIRDHIRKEHSEPALRAACYSFYNRECSPAVMLSTDDLRKGFLAQIDAALSEAERHVNEEGQMRLAVVGSRSFSDQRMMAATLSELAPTMVISGGARGADKMAETWARRNHIETRIFLPQFKVYRHPYHHRNRLIAEACDELIAFWDGHSTGTRYTIDYARRIGKPVRIVRF